MQEAFGLEIRPEFQAIDGERIVVPGLVEVGEGIHALAAFAFDDLAELIVVGSGKFVRGGNGVFPCLLELLELLVVTSDRLIALGNIGRVGLLDLGERYFFVGIVARSDGIGSLKRHVFKHVRQTRFAHRILHGSGIDVSKERKHRGFRALADDDGEAVRKFLYGRALFEGSQVLAENE